jgi:ESS family glutamate:Na+ symporter
VVALIHAIGQREVIFELEMRDRLLVYFFTCIGLNARFTDLIRGGRPLLILLGLTLGFILVQNAVGIAGALLVGAPPQLGVVAGSISLIGGHICRCHQFIRDPVSPKLAFLRKNAKG